MTVRTLREALLRASSFLSTKGIEESMFIAEVLIRSHFEMDRTQFFTSLSELISQGDWKEIEVNLERLASGEPLQYITGKQDFYGETFLVKPGVLIPRPETEILIEQVLLWSKELWDEDDVLRVIDLGTGSGAIPITLAKQRPNWEITALDLSDDALMIAKENAACLRVLDRVHFVKGDMCKVNFTQTFDIVISNPPYIPSEDIPHLQREVRDYEPHLALDGGVDGLYFYRSIINQLGELIQSPGLVAFEVGMGQARDVAVMLKGELGSLPGIGSRSAKKVQIIPDFQQIERVVIGVF